MYFDEIKIIIFSFYRTLRYLLVEIEILTIIESNVSHLYDVDNARVSSLLCSVKGSLATDVSLGPVHSAGVCQYSDTLVVTSPASQVCCSLTKVILVTDWSTLIGRGQTRLGSH